MRAGIELARWFGYEALRIYGSLAASEDDRDALKLAALIRRRGGVVTARDLMAANRRKYPAKDRAEAALQDLVDRGMGLWVEVPAGPQGGAPTRKFRFLENQAQRASHNPPLWWWRRRRGASHNPAWGRERLRRRIGSILRK
jgi:hypothetical protein